MYEIKMHEFTSSDTLHSDSEQLHQLQFTIYIYKFVTKSTKQIISY
jgi:hypothetical protein